MSYARFSKGDVYVYCHVDGDLRCCGCRLWKGVEIIRDHKGMIKHLKEHKKAGHKVPKSAIKRLKKELAEK